MSTTRRGIARFTTKGTCSTRGHEAEPHIGVSSCEGFRPVYYCADCGLCCDALGHGVTLTGAGKCADCYGDPGWVKA